MTTMWKFPKLAVVAILVAMVGAVAGGKCNMPPSLWCSDGEVAENCGVSQNLTILHLERPKLYTKWPQLSRSKCQNL